MRISTKGLYAMRLALYLTERAGGGPVSLKEASEALGISKKYLEQIASSMTAAGLVRSLRGAAGGYVLARPGGDITMRDVVQATEGELSVEACLADGGVDRASSEPVMEVEAWRGLYRVINEYLGGISLQGIVDEYAPSAGDHYSI